eukprot:jgi/Hompol1/3790/HPOL_001678-RA
MPDLRASNRPPIPDPNPSTVGTAGPTTTDTVPLKSAQSAESVATNIREKKQEPAVSAEPIQVAPKEKIQEPKQEWVVSPLLPPPILPQDLPKPATVLGEWKDHYDKLEILIAENDHLAEQNHAVSKEANDLRDQVSKYSRTLNTQLSELEHAKQHIAVLETEIGQLVDTKTALEREIKNGTTEVAHSHADIDALQSELRQKQTEIESGQTKIAELKKALMELSDRYQVNIKESASFSLRERELLDDIKTKSSMLEEYHVKLVHANKEATEAREENEKLMAVNKGLEAQIEQLQRKEVVYLQEAHQRMQELEEARFERDRAAERESRSLQEIAQLSSRLNELPEKYAEKTEAAVQLLRNQFNVDRRRFADETAKLETLCATLQNQVERAIREKRAAESELEKMTRHIPAESDRLTMMIEELHLKLRASERERNDALHKLESVHQKSIREENQFESERQQLGQRAEEAYRRLRKVERELEETKEERISMYNKNSSLEHERKTLIESRTKKQIQHEAEIAALIQKNESMVSELTAKLENVTEAHSKTCREMQQLLSDQRRLGDKWKEESLRMTEHSENALAHARAQLAQFQAKISDLETQLQRASAKHRDLMDQVSHEKREQSVLHSRCLNAENRIDALGRQIGILVAKEAEMLQERKRLQRDLDRAVMEKDRLQKDARHQIKHDLNVNGAKIR